MSEGRKTSSSTARFTKDSVASADGTTIGFRHAGSGAGIVLVHGGMKSSRDFSKLAIALSDAFSVYVMDRRGRGLSGPHGEGFSVQKEVDDLTALVTKTGARFAFGLSVGALVVLRAARALPALERIALYEPPLSIRGSAPTAWLARFERELTRDHVSSAVVTAMKGMRVVPLFDVLPRFMLVPLLSLVMRVQGAGDEDDVPIRALAPTLRYDIRIVKETSDSLDDVADLHARVLLLGGNKSPSYLRVALDGLERTLPHVERVTFPSLGHDGPEDDGHPELVARELRRFFLSSH